MACKAVRRALCGVALGFYIVVYIIILEKELRVMSKIYQGAVELIGNTPLVEVTNLEKKQELKINQNLFLFCIYGHTVFL